MARPARQAHARRTLTEAARVGSATALATSYRTRLGARLTPRADRQPGADDEGPPAAAGGPS